MAIRDTAWGFVPKIGDGISWVTQKISEGLSSAFGIDVTAFQSRLITLMVLAFIIYLVLSVLTISKKLIKWSLVILLIILTLSVLVSIVA
ncbi:MAG: hypothetical protein NT076_03805 [Candidatus Pacearchaeota archaeon]|nr:hypothetical protein [Candidatus Pacearchaeota archaeon]